MQHQQLFINDQQCDLSDDNPIALTFQINDLAEVKNQQGNTSNQFKLPNTQVNRRIFGYPDDIKSTQRIVYQKLNALYIVKGIEVFPNAIAEVNDSDEQSISITLLSGNVDFFDSLGGQLIDMGDSTSRWSNYGKSLVWKPYDHVWNLQNVATSQKNTADSGNNGIGGWIYPVVDYGLFTDDFTQPLDVHYMRPGFFIKTAIDLLIKSTGYTAKGSLLTNPLYPLLIAQFSNGSWDHGIDYKNQPDLNGCVASLGQQVQASHPDTVSGRVGVIIFGQVASNPNNLYNPGTGFYTSNEIISVNVSLRIPSFYFFGNYNGTSASNIDINIVYTDPVNGDLVLATTNFSLSGNPALVRDPAGRYRFGYVITTNSVLSFQTELPVNGKISIQWEFKGLTDSIFSMAAGAQLVIKADNNSVVFGQQVQCEMILPQVSQKDLMKDTLQRFGIICQTDIYSATINFASLKDIVNNIPIAKDWSTKVLNQGKDVSFKLGDNYGQLNTIEYQVDPNSGLRIIPLKFGWSKIVINDQTLSVFPNSMIVSIFGASLNSPFVGGVTAYVQMADPTTGTNDLNISVAPRILISNKVDLMALGKTVQFTDGQNSVYVNDIIDCPYFNKPGGKYSLLWEDLRLLYYSELEQILKDTKKVTRYFHLTAQDVQDIDLLIPVFIDRDNCYYYINSINDWRAGQPTKVVLVKLG